MKKIISLLLCAALALSLIPIGMLSASAETYWVTYHYNCKLPGETSDHIERAQTDDDGYVDQYPDNLPDLYEDRLFIWAWYTDQAMTEMFDFSKPTNKSLNLYARWVSLDDCCDFYIYLSAVATEPTSGIDVPYGEVLGEIAEPGREDADFGGWYTDRALTKPYDPTKPITEDTSVFAKWNFYSPQITSIANVYGGVSVNVQKINVAPKYRFFRKEAGTGWRKVADTTSPTLLDRTAVSGTKYWYTVRVLSLDGTSYQSGYDRVGKSITYIAAPVISQFQNINTGTTVTWKASKGAAYYRLFQKNGTSWKALGDTTGTSLTVKNRVGGTKYVYTVRAMNSKKQYISGYNTTGWSYTFIAAPALPTLSNTRNGVRITYTKPAGGVYFRIFRKTGTGKWTKLADTSYTSVVDITAKNGVRYTYTIRCISKDGTKYYSGYNTTGRSIVCKR